jgi:hypothetical protein
MQQCQRRLRSFTQNDRTKLVTEWGFREEFASTAHKNIPLPFRSGKGVETATCTIDYWEHLTIRYYLLCFTFNKQMYNNLQVSGYKSMNRTTHQAHQPSISYIYMEAV